MAESRDGMRIKDRAEFKSKPRPLTFGPDATVAEAVDAMCSKGYGSVIVVDADEKVLGVATERDVMSKVVRQKLDASTTPLSAIMTTEPRVASEDDSIVDWLRIMSNERFRRLPVVDREGRIKMVFTQGDFVSYTWPDLLNQARQLASATVASNFPTLLVIGGVALYSILMVVVVGLVI